MERWCRCIVKELENVRCSLSGDCHISTIYCGGGTPSYLPVALWSVLLKELARFPCTEDCEFTVEANPESVDEKKLSVWKQGGVNRVSLGIQSLDDQELRMIARPHSSFDALKALELCMKKNFRVSGDLIFGLPGQTLRRWHNSMSRLAAEGLRHISVYQLMIEPESYWGQHTPSHLPDGYPMYRWAQYYLPHKGLRQYEIASFAVPGEESRHNLAYWRRSSVYAAGPAAWGFINGCRFENCSDFNEWAEDIEQQRSPVTYREHMYGGREASEAAVLALRTCFGIQFEEFSSRYGSIWLEEILRRLRQLPPQDFYWTDKSVALSPRGMRVGNSIWTELIDLEQCDKS